MPPIRVFATQCEVNSQDQVVATTTTILIYFDLFSKCLAIELASSLPLSSGMVSIFGSREPSLFIADAAVLLGVSRRTVYYWIGEGRLKTLRTRGGSQRVLLSSIERLLRAQHGLPPLDDGRL